MCARRDLFQLDPEDATQIDYSYERILLEVEQFDTNHNGGEVCTRARTRAYVRIRPTIRQS